MLNATTISDDGDAGWVENLVESSLALNTIYRIVRHFYLLSKKTSSFYLILQLQMILPLVMQEAEALQGASQAFAQGQPIGDGIGALVASKFMLNKILITLGIIEIGLVAALVYYYFAI